MEYLIVWEIELDAGSPEEAARLALKIIRDKASMAHVFKVYDESGEEHSIDLDQIDQSA